MRNEHIHLAKSGRLFHDIVGPISNPSDGPTLPNALSVMVMALVLSIPQAIMVKEHTRLSMRYIVRNDRSVRRRLFSMFTPFILTGNTALGWRMCLNSFLIIFSSITPRMDLNPPLVLPEHAPINMQSASATHVTCGHCPASSLKMPVVVRNDTTWKRPQRKACSKS